jgi:predicted ATP-grasp superfamily ATP-dependent carboligase
MISARSSRTRNDASDSAPRVLLTNAEERSMLAVTRCLHMSGYRVTAASPTRLASSQWSRTCDRRVCVPDARSDTPGFLKELRRELQSNRYETLIAGSDSALLAISRDRAQLDELTKLGLPSHSVVQACLNRERLAEAAAQVGLTPAMSIRCSNHQEVLVAAKELGFPIVLKSTDAAIDDTPQSVQPVPKGHVVSDPKELDEALSSFAGDLLVQRYLRGTLLSLGGVIADGQLLGLAVSRYHRTWPPTGGSLSYGETVSPPAILEDLVEHLLGVLKWEGIFELELIQKDTDGYAGETGAFVPIDLNPRPYGSMALARAAGAPLASIWCDWLLKRSPPNTTRPIRALAGYRYRWEDGDLRHLWWQLRRGRLRAAAAPLRPHRRVTYAHFEHTDPMPLLARSLFLCMRTIRPRTRTESSAA